MVTPDNVPLHLQPGQTPDVSGLLAYLGVPPYIRDGQEPIQTHILSAMIVEFSDGEVEYQGTRPKDLEEAVWLGERLAGEGALVRALRVERENDSSPIKPLIERVERYCGCLVAYSTVRGGPFDMSDCQVTTEVKNRRVAVGGTMSVAMELDTPIQSVVHYGPSIQGQHYVQSQTEALQSGRVPFTCIPIARTPFIAEFLKRYFQYRLLNPSSPAERYDSFERIVQAPIFQAKENGMAAGSAELIAQREQAGERIDYIDVVACSGLYSARSSEMRVGLANAHRLLREGAHC